MWPILLKLGSFTLQTVGILHTLGIVTAIWWAWRKAPLFEIEKDDILNLSWTLVLWAVIGARVFSIFFDGSLLWYLHHPIQMLMVWHGGFTFYGGFLFAATAGIWYVHKRGLDGWNIADTIAPALALGIAVGRLGCLASGDSYGKVTHVPWAITFTNPHSLAPVDLPLHPTQIYAVIGALLVFILLGYWYHQRQFKGELFLVFMMSYAVERSFVEIFRNDPRGVYLNGWISTSQIISLFVFIAGVWMYFKFRSSNNKRESPVAI